MTEILSFTSSLITQGKYRFYSLTMDSDLLKDTCYVIEREKDPLVGFQRHLDEKRAKDIAKYMDSGMGTIPTAIILSAQKEADFQYDSKKRTISFKKIKNAFLILDGQHRVYGFHLAKVHLRVPVVIYNGLSRVEESRLFIDINTKQRQIPRELLLDIRKLAEYQEDIETLLGEVFDYFDTDLSSPLFGLMSPTKKMTGQKISRVTFNSGLKRLMVHFEGIDAKDIYEVLSSYFNAVMHFLKKESSEDLIVKTGVFQAFIDFFPEVAQRVDLPRIVDPVPELVTGFVPMR